MGFAATLKATPCDWNSPKGNAFPATKRKSRAIFLARMRGLAEVAGGRPKIPEIYCYHLGTLSGGPASLSNL
jgi:hypothetical protein